MTDDDKEQLAESLGAAHHHPTGTNPGAPLELLGYIHKHTSTTTATPENTRAETQTQIDNPQPNTKTDRRHP